jgi:hypothetical protein
MNQYNERDDDLFYFDRIMGRILDMLFGIGLLAAIIAAGYLWEFLK